MRISSLDRLLERLASPSEDDRCDALWYLGYRYPWRSARPGRRQRRQAAARIVALLRDDPSERVRRDAAHVLRCWTGERDFDPTPHLLEALRDDPAGRVRGEAAEGLGCRCRSTPRIEAALAAGLSDPDPHPRFWCLYAAGQLQLEALRPQIEALIDDPGEAEMWWTVGQEARDVLTYWDTGGWPDHPPPEPAA